MQVQGSQYEVQEILAEKVFKGTPHFLIKWKGYPKNQSTWEPIENLQHCINFLISWKKQKVRDQLKQKPENTTKKTLSKSKGGRKLICKQDQDFQEKQPRSNSSRLRVSLGSQSVRFQQGKQFKNCKTQVTTRKAQTKLVEGKTVQKTVIHIEDDTICQVENIDVQKLRNQKLDLNGFEQTKDPENSETNEQKEAFEKVQQCQKTLQKDQYCAIQKSNSAQHKQSQHSRRSIIYDLEKLDPNPVRSNLLEEQRQQGQLQIGQIDLKSSIASVQLENSFQVNRSNGYSYRSAPVFINSQISINQRSNEMNARTVITESTRLPTNTRHTTWLQNARNLNNSIEQQVDGIVAEQHSQPQVPIMKEKEQQKLKNKSNEQQKKQTIQVMEEPESKETNIEKVKDIDQQCIIGIDKIGVHNGKQKCIGLISLKRVHKTYPNVLLNYFMDLAKSHPVFNQPLEDSEFE